MLKDIRNFVTYINKKKGFDLHILYIESFFLKRDETFADKQAKEENKEASAKRFARINICLRISTES